MTDDAWVSRHAVLRELQDACGTNIPLLRSLTARVTALPDLRPDARKIHDFVVEGLKGVGGTSKEGGEG